jgi:hypothetical protein
MKRIISIVFIISLGLEVFAQPAAIADFIIKNQTEKVVCFQSTISFINTSTLDTLYPNKGVCFIWDFGDNSPKDTVGYKKDSLTNRTVTHLYANDGKYTVILSIIDSSNLDTVIATPKKRLDVIKIYSPKMAAFDKKIDDFETYNYTFTIPTSFKPFDPKAWTYDWDFGDGTSELTDSNAIFHHFKEENLKPGYNVTLTVKLKDEIVLSNKKTAECFDSVSVVYQVSDGFFKIDSSNKKKPLIPNIFTPNGDNVNEEITLSMSDTTTANAVRGNDVFVFKANGEQLFSFWVYNRWGQLVYKTENKIITWNGKSSSGDDLNSGVYYYVIQSNASDKRHNTAGVIHLFRE